MAKVSDREVMFLIMITKTSSEKTLKSQNSKLIKELKSKLENRKESKMSKSARNTTKTVQKADTVQKAAASKDSSSKAPVSKTSAKEAPTQESVTTLAAGLIYNPEKAKHHEALANFIKVRNENKPPGARTIRGASKVWKTNPEFIYVPRYRLTGTEPDVRAALHGAKFTAEEIDAAMELAIRSTNYETTHAQAYEDEINLQKLDDGYKLSDLEYWESHMTDVIRKNKKGQVVPNKGFVVKSTKTGTSLVNKVGKLKEGEFYDVSKYNNETQSGAKKVHHIPRNKFQDEGAKYPFVSDNVENYVAALQAITPNFNIEDFQVQIASIKKQVTALANKNRHIPRRARVVKVRSETVKPKAEAKPKAEVKPKTEEVPAVAKSVIPRVNSPTRRSKVKTIGAANLPSLPALKK